MWISWKTRAPSFRYRTGYASYFSVSYTHRKNYRQLKGLVVVVMRLLGLVYSVRRDHVTLPPLQRCASALAFIDKPIQQISLLACHKLQQLGKETIEASVLTLILLTWTIWRSPTNAIKWRIGFNSAFKGLINKIIQRPESFMKI